jgi:fatty-acyl-CoA synthase
MTSNTYDQHLERNAANFQAWTPLSFLERTAGIFPDHVAVVHGDIRRTYRDLFEQARRLASALTKAGYWSNEDIMARNIPVPTPFDLWRGAEDQYRQDPEVCLAPARTG